MLNMKAIAAGIALAALPFAASAATFSIDAASHSPQGPLNGAGVDYAVGYGAITPSGSSWSVDPSFAGGNVSGATQSPFNSNPLTPTNSYFAAGNAFVASPVTLTFAAIQTSFSLLWGSIDSYNSITFSGGSSADVTYTGDDIASYLGLTTSTQNYEHVALVSFEDMDFTTVTFTSGAKAFEFALAPVPVPAAGVLMVAALGGLGLVRRRKSAA